jgi:hypothetical protein
MRDEVMFVSRTILADFGRDMPPLPMMAEENDEQTDR